MYKDCKELGLPYQKEMWETRKKSSSANISLRFSSTSRKETFFVKKPSPLIFCLIKKKDILIYFLP